MQGWSDWSEAGAKLASQAVRGPNRADAWRGAGIGSVRPGFVPNANFLPLQGREAPRCPVESRSDEFPTPPPRARKPLNVVAAWIAL
jgi:hypothetical protein